MKKYYRIYAVLLVLVLVVGLASGCTKDTPPVSAEKEKITLWYYWGQKYNQRELANLVYNFNQAQERIEVIAEYVPDEDFKKRLALSMADDTMPELALVDSSDFQYFNHMKPFVDLTDEIEGIEEYLPQAKAACSVNGRMMGLPYGMNCSALYYNKEIFKKHNVQVPTTWQEIYDTAILLSTEGSYGFATPALKSEASVYSFLPILWGFGGDIDALDSAESKYGFRFLRELTKAGGMCSQAINLTEGDLLQKFVEGNIAMMVNSTGMIDSVREEDPTLQYGVTSLPLAGDGSQVGVLGGEVFGVAEGPHQEAAIQFLQYISDKDRMAEYMEESSSMAPRQDVLENQYTKDPLKREMIQLVESSRPREFSVEWPYISYVITDAMEGAIIGEKNEDEILSEAADHMADIRRRGL